MSSKHDWICVFRDAGLEIYVPQGSNDAQQFITSKGAGALIGIAFDANGREIKAGSGSEASVAEAAFASDGSTLVEIIWGRYVTFLHPNGGRITHVIRDPSGQVPCYSISTEGMNFVFSDLVDLPTCALKTSNINRKLLVQFLLALEVSNDETGLDNAREIFPGERASFYPDEMQRAFIWTPSSFIQKPFETFSEASDALSDATGRCIARYAKNTQRVVLKLSGGFDSSAVLGFLRQTLSPDRITCAHFHSSTSDGDERYYARLVAERSNVKLVEDRYDAERASVRTALEISPPTARPSVNFSALLEREQCVALLERENATAIWSGHGGDHIFNQTRSPYPAIDYLFHRKSLDGLWGALMDGADVSGQSFWSVAALSIRHGLLRRPFVRPLTHVRPLPFLNEDDLQSFHFSEVHHPWVTQTVGLAPGEQSFISSTANVLSYDQPHARLSGCAEFYPLLSQPVIETCLRTPTSMTILNGVQRAVARDAYKGVIPSEIIRRRTKGGNTSYFAKLFERERSFIRSYMLDGVTAKEGLIDRARLEHFLAPTSLLNLYDLIPFYRHLAVECWLRGWQQQQFRAAA